MYLESRLMFIARSVSDNNIASINDFFSWVKAFVVHWKQLCSQCGVHLPLVLIIKKWDQSLSVLEGTLHQMWLCWSSPVNTCSSSVMKHRAPREGPSVSVSVHFQIAVRGRGFINNVLMKAVVLFGCQGTTESGVFLFYPVMRSYFEL